MLGLAEREPFVGAPFDVALFNASWYRTIDQQQRESMVLCEMVRKLVRDKEAAPKRGPGRPRSFDPVAALAHVQSEFWNRGYSATSLDDLAAATGLNRPSLYAAFGDKQALYMAALDKSRAEAGRALLEALAGDEPLRQCLERVFSHAAQMYMRGDLGQRGCFLVGTAVTEAVTDANIRHALGCALDNLDKAFEQRFRRASQAGELARDADIPALAKLATATLNGMAIRARAGGDAKTLAQLAKGFVALTCGVPGSQKKPVKRRVGSASPRKRTL